MVFFLLKLMFSFIGRLKWVSEWTSLKLVGEKIRLADWQQVWAGASVDQAPPTSCNQRNMTRKRQRAEQDLWPTLCLLFSDNSTHLFSRPALPTSALKAPTLWDVHFTSSDVSLSCQWTPWKWQNSILYFFCLLYSLEKLVLKLIPLEICPLWHHSWQKYFSHIVALQPWSPKIFFALQLFQSWKNGWSSSTGYWSRRSRSAAGFLISTCEAISVLAAGERWRRGVAVSFEPNQSRMKPSSKWFFTLMFLPFLAC